MGEGNHSVVTEFILSGLTDHPQLQIPLFLLFLLIYVTTLVGNGGMIWLLSTDPRLHTPMYFFIVILFFCDICCSSTIAPKMILDFLAKRKTISYTDCAVQTYFSILLSDVECLLLTVMAYDRYVAICNPLLYTVIMSKQHCGQLVAGACIVGLVDAMIQTCLTFQLSFCRSNVINHYFCDVAPLLALSCSDYSLIDIVLFALACFINLNSFMTILLSYVCIFSTVLHIHSAKGRHKTFSTCACHLTAVVILYGTGLFIYLRPMSTYSADMGKITSVFYMMVIPMLNPFIYSLRNKEVKVTLRKTMNKLLTNF
ncbi:olfactory receptor 5AR1-like [Pelodiscus sinensis]|uniref:olfactory receptor 5AR1-like n=1 Tax=Pelodiscus sinensis TaxID=13735 RepID=UPI003F6B52F3